MKRRCSFIGGLALTVLLAVHSTYSAGAHESESVSQEVEPDVLDFYRQFSYFTDPGEYTYLFEGLPDSLQELCDLIKCQFIHPADIGPFRSIIPAERHNEDDKFRNVRELLQGLMELDGRGLTSDREPVNRRVVYCLNHSIFLASILKYQGVPARVRCGFASYLAPGTGYHIGHVICEVWNDDEKRWMFVDPDRKKVDIPREQFELAGDVWLRLQEGKVDPRRYIGGADLGDGLILDALCRDLPAVLGEERSVWESAPICANGQMKWQDIESGKLEVLNQVALYLSNPELHLDALQALYKEHSFLHYEPIPSGIAEYWIFH